MSNRNGEYTTERQRQRPPMQPLATWEPKGESQSNEKKKDRPGANQDPRGRRAAREGTKNGTRNTEAMARPKQRRQTYIHANVGRYQSGQDHSREMQKRARSSLILSHALSYTSQRPSCAPILHTGRSARRIDIANRAWRNIDKQDRWANARRGKWVPVRTKVIN